VLIESGAPYVEAGEAPLAAALKGAQQIGFPIVSLTVSLIAVLIPLLFMGDVVGRLFREFAVTLAVTILLSAVVSLTLTPMMCSKLLGRQPLMEGRRRFARRAEELGAHLVNAYSDSLAWVMKHETATLVFSLALLIAAV